MAIEIRGVDQLFKKLDKAAATQTLIPPMQRSVLRLQRDMQEYPPPPPPIQGPASRPVRFTTRAGRAVEFIARSPRQYRRTGTLGRRWVTRVRAVQGGLEGHVGNNTRYAPWVQSEQFQARIHRNRWRTDQQAVERNAPAIVVDFKRAMDEALR